MRRLAFLTALLLAGCPGPAPEASPAMTTTSLDAPSRPPSPTSGFVAPALPPVAIGEAIARGEPLVFVDVEAKSDYDVQHIAGALNAPLERLGEVHATLPKDKLLVLYCSCADEHLSGMAAVKLHDQYGFTRLATLKGGIYAWRQAGHKLWKAPAP